MLKRFVFILTIVVLAASLAGSAELTQVTSGGMLNGEAVGSLPATLAAGDRVTGPAEILTASGDRLQVSADSVIEIQNPEGEIELFFVRQGSVRGEIGANTSVAVPTGWLSAKDGRTEFFAETIDSRRGFFKVNAGQGLVIYENLHVALNEGNGIEIEKIKAGGARYTTHQNNSTPVHMIARITTELEIDLMVPKATTGTISPEEKGKKTRITSDPISWKSGQIGLETKLDGDKKQSGTLGPGTFAVIDNSTGVIEFAFVEIDFQIIERATSLTSEFSTLAASNFFGFEEFDKKFN